MTTCIKIRGKKRELCAGDLDRLITLQKRTITVPTPESETDYDEDFDDIDDVLAMVLTTKKGTIFFSDTNTEKTIDIEFYIAFLDGITAETWIKFEDENYEILFTEDLDKRHQYLRLVCTERGDADIAVNKA